MAPYLIIKLKAPSPLRNIVLCPIVYHALDVTSAIGRGDYDLHLSATNPFLLYCMTVMTVMLSLCVHMFACLDSFLFTTPQSYTLIVNTVVLISRAVGNTRLCIS